MNTYDAVRAYCLAKPGATAEYPFGLDHLVPKVGGKMFAIISETSSPITMNLKNTPEVNLALRDRWKAVKPGYHQNKLHWNTVTLDGTIPDEDIYKMIDDSYRIVFDSLTKKIQMTIADSR